MTLANNSCHHSLFSCLCVIPYTVSSSAVLVYLSISIPALPFPTQRAFRNGQLSSDVMASMCLSFYDNYLAF